MNTITLNFKGDVRVMFFGKEGWGMKNGVKPECDHAFFGFTRIESIECDDRNILRETGETDMPHYLDGIHSCLFEGAGEHLLYFDDFENVEIPVTFDVDYENEKFCLMLMKDYTRFEGKEEFCIPYLVEAIEGDGIRTIIGDYDKMIVEDIVSKCKLYGDCSDKAFSERDIPKSGMRVKEQNHPMTEISVGEKRVLVPCIVANDVKHLINKFRLNVTDVKVIKPYYMDEWQYQDYYELYLYMKPSKVLRTRKFRKAFDDMCRRFLKRYSWDVFFDY